MLKRIWDFIVEDCWWSIQDFFTSYIWPAYKVKNFFWKRFDLVKLPQIKRSEYSDVRERILWANVELLKFFIEKEKPEEHVEWYGEWGPKFPYDMRFPEYEGKYVMDIVKEAYNWFTVERPKMVKDMNYLLDLWSTHLYGKLTWKKIIDKPDYCKLDIDNSELPKDLKYFEDKGLDWSILDRYLYGDRENVLKENFILNRHNDLEIRIDNLDKKYLQMIIAVRVYMWT